MGLLVWAYTERLRVHIWCLDVRSNQIADVVLLLRCPVRNGLTDLLRDHFFLGAMVFVDHGSSFAD